MDMSKKVKRDPRMSDRGRRETKNRRKWENPCFSGYIFYQNFFPGFPKEKNQNREQLQSSGKHVKRENQFGQGRKDSEVSGRADQGKTGAYIVQCSCYSSEVCHEVKFVKN